MRALLLIALFASAVLAAPSTREGCPADCVLPDCRCASTDIPGGLSLDETPQFVTLTFDDAVNVINIEYYKEIFTGKTNQDGCPAAATFYNSHEYTDYSLLHSLWAQGHEIALHSISHRTDLPYWAGASVEELAKEFDGQRDLINKFGNIPKEDISGIRMPFLQMAGDNQFEMLSKYGFQYDCSWPTQSYMNPGLWPYTLDEPSPQDCSIPPCPVKSHPGTWVAPMINWYDQKNIICSMVDACVNIPADVDGLVNFMKDNFNRQYKGNKAPFGFYLHSAWFSVAERLEAYKQFFSYLQTLPDVYIVPVGRVIEWVRNPVPLSQISTSSWSAACNKVKTPSCTKRACELLRDGIEWPIWMTSCAVSCPAKYPWVGNPLGTA